MLPACLLSVQIEPGPILFDTQAEELSNFALETSASPSRTSLALDNDPQHNLFHVKTSQQQHADQLV